MRKTNLTMWICVVIAMICVTACSSDASSPDSPTQLGAPKSLTAVSKDSQVSLSWSKVANASGYTVYYSTKATIDIEVAKTAKQVKKLGAVTTAVINTLTNGTAYCFAVAATNASGESPLSTLVSCTPKAIIVAPAAPTGVTATAANRAYEITLTWEASSGATSYVLYCGSKSGFAPSDPGVRINTITEGTTFVDRNLSPGVMQYYTLVASNLAGNSPPCAEVSALTAPAFPSEFSAIPQAQSVFLRWKPVTGAASYKLYWSTDSSANITTEAISSVELAAVETAFVDKTVTSLVNGTAYYFIVTAISASKLESTGSPAIKSIPAVTAENAPRNLRAIAEGTTINLSWDASMSGTDAGYNIYRSLTSGVTASGPPLFRLKERQLANIELDRSTTYYYIVTAYIDSGESSLPSNEASATTVPLAPANPARTISREQVALSWTASPAASGYKIYRAAAKTDTQRTLLGTLNDAGAVAYSDTSIVAGVEYGYEIKAFNGAGESEAAVLSALTIPAAPALSLTKESSIAITLSWTQSPGAACYKIYRSLSPASPATNSSAAHTTRNSRAGNTETAEEFPVTIADSSITTYRDTSASATTTSYYSVASCNASGESAFSNEVAGKRCDPIPETPTDVDAKALAGADAGKILISWKACKDATSYSLFWSTTSPVDTTEANKSVINNLPETRYVHADPNPGIAYFYVAKAYNATQTSAPSEITSAIPTFKDSALLLDPIPVRPAIIQRGVSSPVASNNIPFVLNNHLYRVEGCSWDPSIVSASNECIALDASKLAQSPGVSIVERDNYMPSRDVRGTEGVTSVGADINAVLPWVAVDKDPANSNVETAFLFVVSGKDLTKLYLYTSTDARTWKDEGLQFTSPASGNSGRILTASIAKTASGYTMMITRKQGADSITNHHGLFFQATTLRGSWSPVPNAQYIAPTDWESSIPNCIYFDATSGYYYLFSYTGWVNQTFLSRSTDLVNWTNSPFAPIFIPTRAESKKLFYPESSYLPEQITAINQYSLPDPIQQATALNVRLCEYMDNGTRKVVIEYNNGLFQEEGPPIAGSNFEAEYVGTLTDFLTGFFPAKTFPSKGWEGIHREYESDVNSKFSTNRSSYGRIVSIDEGVELNTGEFYLDWNNPDRTDPKINLPTQLCALFDGNSRFAWAFHTQKTKDATATIALPSPKTITGILVYNRNTSINRLLGCTLEILGADGKWKEYYTFEDKDLLTQQTEIDLRGKNVVSNSIRITKPFGTLHLYHMEIWGG